MDQISMITDDDLVKNKYTKHPSGMTDPESINQFYTKATIREETSS